MRWNRLYSFKSYIKSALWVVPVFALLTQLAVTRLMHAIGEWLRQAGYIDETTSLLSLGMSGTRSLLETVITLNISFIVFTFGSLLVAIQVASGQYTPRIIATTLLRDNAIRFSVGFFVFTLLFSLRTLELLETTVHQFNTFLSGLLGMSSIAIFLYLIDYAARMLRPVAIVQRVLKDGLAVIKKLYPHPTVGALPVPSRYSTGAPRRTVSHEGNSGIVLAVNLAGLVAHAQRVNGIIEFVPRVGDFVAVNEPLFILYGGADAIDDSVLRATVAFGTERTIEQDPTFAFRILVDIANKALSPAINDPTTATLVIDQLHRLLLLVGKQNLSGEEINDKDGQLRVIFRTPNWEDFVHLTFTEIRHYGAGNIQIARRLRSMMEMLILSLPEHRHPALKEEFVLLDRTLEKHYVFPEDLALARVPDAQGIGSSRNVQQ